MEKISRNLLSYKAVIPRWFVLLLIIGGLLAGASMLTFNQEEPQIVKPQSSGPPVNMAPSQPNHGRGPASIKPSPPPPASSAEPSQLPGGLFAEFSVGKPAIVFGIAFCTIAALTSFLVLLISLPVFLFSTNPERVARAGGLVKTTLGFFIGSAGTILATISFAPA